MIKHKKIIISLLLAYALFIIGVFNVHALNFDNLTDIQLVRVSVQGNRVNSSSTYFDDFNSEYFENYSLTTGTITLPSGDYKTNSDYVYFSLGVFANYSGYEFDSDNIHADYESQVIDYSANIGIDTNVGYVYCDYNTDSGIAFCPFNSVGATNITRVHVTFDFSKYSSLNHNGIHYGYLYGVDWYFCNSYSKKTKDSSKEIADNTKDINDSINDSSIDTDNTDSSVGGFSSSTNSNMTNTPVSSMISLPITFLTGVNNALSSSCTNVNYIELFNYQLVLPCLNLSDRLGSVWTIIDTIFSCMLIFSIGKSLVSTFARLSDMDTNIMYECYANGTKHRGESFDD